MPYVFFSKRGLVAACQRERAAGSRRPACLSLPRAALPQPPAPCPMPLPPSLRPGGAPPPPRGPPGPAESASLSSPALQSSRPADTVCLRKRGLECGLCDANQCLCTAASSRTVSAQHGPGQAAFTEPANGGFWQPAAQAARPSAPHPTPWVSLGVLAPSGHPRHSFGVSPAFPLAPDTDNQCPVPPGPRGLSPR